MSKRGFVDRFLEMNEFMFRRWKSQGFFERSVRPYHSLDSSGALRPKTLSESSTSLFSESDKFERREANSRSHSPKILGYRCPTGGQDTRRGFGENKGTCEMRLASQGIRVHREKARRYAKELMQEFPATEDSEQSFST